jgi:endo-1,4-beta-xylanase
VTAADLVNNVIPQHVQQQISGMGSNVTSWDVMNELIGDATTAGMTALQCVQNKDAWPTVVADGSSTPLVTDLSFVHAAYKTALAAAAPGTRLSYNDYSTGGNDTKTACVFQLLADINKNAGVPYDRLAVGFQSHVTAQPYYFDSKSDLKATFARLAGLGAKAYVTEIDIRVNSNSTTDARYQAAIWGDYLDVRLLLSRAA